MAAAQCVELLTVDDDRGPKPVLCRGGRWNRPATIFHRRNRRNIKGMKVKELISALQNYDPEREIQIGAEGNYWDVIEVGEWGKYVVIESND